MRTRACTILVSLLTLTACGGDELAPARAFGDAAATDALLGPDGAPLGDGAGAPDDDSGLLNPDDLDAGYPPTIDAGRAFDYAPAYVETLGPSSRSDAGHAFAGNTPPSNPKDSQCIDCHKSGGAAGSRPFFAGGTVKFTNGSPAPKVEVRLKTYLSANAVNAYTDDDGNWFIPLEAAPDAGVTFPVRPGVRNATSLRTMGPSPVIGRCNQCHIASL